MSNDTKALVERLRIRASIRRRITTRKSVQEGKPDRIADLLEEAATALASLDESTVLDAKRYRWLRYLEGDLMVAKLNTNPREWYSGTILDAAIDAAMSAHEAAGKDR